MTTRRGGPVVLLSDRETAPALAERLAHDGRSVTWYTSLEDLVREQSLDAIAVLVAYSRRPLGGSLLVTLGRLNLEYPHMQKIALMDAPPPLPVAGYLTACGVDLVWEGSGEERTERLTSAVERMRSGGDWVVA